MTHLSEQLENGPRSQMDILNLIHRTKHIILKSKQS